MKLALKSLLLILASAITSWLVFGLFMFDLNTSRWDSFAIFFCVLVSVCLSWYSIIIALEDE